MLKEYTMWMEQLNDLKKKMIYYIEYSREQQKLLSFLTYPESDRALAQAHALKREIELSRLPGGLKLEIVMLEADSEARIRNTNLRYFGNPFSASLSTPTSA